MSTEYQAKHKFTPETVLASGLRKQGIEVDTVSHAAFCSSEGYDIVHVHHLGKGAIRMAATRSRVSFVFTPHDGRLLCGYEHSPVRKSAFWYVMKRCDASVALSNVEARFLSRYARGSRVSVIPNGIPADVFHPADPSTNHEPRRMRLLYVGSLASAKGVDILLNAVKRLAGTWDIELSLVYQYAGLEDEYKLLASRLGLTDRVRFVGFLGAGDVGAEYQRADVTVLPSYAEALPSVITESLLCGKPVVATDVGGIREQLGPYGVIVPSGNVDQLVAGLDGALHNLPLFKTLGAEMREYAIRRFDPAVMAKSHIDLYETVQKEKTSNAYQRRPAVLDRIFSLAVELRG